MPILLLPCAVCLMRSDVHRMAGVCRVLRAIVPSCCKALGYLTSLAKGLRTKHSSKAHHAGPCHPPSRQGYCKPQASKASWTMACAPSLGLQGSSDRQKCTLSGGQCSSRQHYMDASNDSKAFEKGLCKECWKHRHVSRCLLICIPCAAGNCSRPQTQLRIIGLLEAMSVLSNLFKGLRHS